MATNYTPSSKQQTKRKQVNSILNGGGGFLEQIVLGGYSSMPRAVRVGVFIVAFLVLVYSQALLPSVISGRLINTENPAVPLTGKVYYWIENHRSSTEINSATGGWSVPMHWRLPVAVNLEFEVLASRPTLVKVAFSDVLIARLTSEPIRIEASRDREGKADGFQLQVRTASGTVVQNLLASLSGIFTGTALAQAPSTHPTVQSLNAKQILDTASKVAGSPVTGSDHVADRLQNPLDRSTFFYDVEQQFRVRVSLEARNKPPTFNDLISEVDHRSKLYAVLASKLPGVLAPYKKDRSFWVAPEFPQDGRLEKAFEKLGVSPQDQTGTVAFLDATLFGNGSEGMLFTSRGLYYRTSWARSTGPKSSFVPYEEFAERRFEAAGVFEVSLDRGQSFVVAGSGVSVNRLLAALTSIKKVVADHNR